MSYNTKAASFEICPAEDTSALAIEAYIRCAALQAAAAYVGHAQGAFKDALNANPDGAGAVMAEAVIDIALVFEQHLRRPR